MNLGICNRLSIREAMATLGKVMRVEPKIAPQPVEAGDVRDTWANVSRAAELIGTADDRRPAAFTVVVCADAHLGDGGAPPVVSQLAANRALEQVQWLDITTEGATCEAIVGRIEAVIGGVVVTGCTGYIGSHLTEWPLVDGRQAVGFDWREDCCPRAISETDLADALNPRPAAVRVERQNRRPSGSLVCGQPWQAAMSRN